MTPGYASRATAKSGLTNGRTRGRRRRLLATLSSLLLLATVVAGVSSAAPPVSPHYPLGTAAPDPAAAVVLSDPGSSAERPRVKVCFDQPVTPTSISGFNGSTTAGLISLRGYDVNRSAQAGEAYTIDGEPRCLVTRFAIGVDVRSFTLVDVEQGAVTGSTPTGEVGNVEASVALDGSRVELVVGRGAGPNLTGAAPADSATNQVVYTFDHQVDPNSCGDPGAFGYYAAGSAVATLAAGGACAVANSDDGTARVTVTFGGPVTNPSKFIVRKDAVSLRGGNLENGSLPGQGGGSAAAPNLVSARSAYVGPPPPAPTPAPARPSVRMSLVPPVWFDFTYDVPVTGSDPSACRIIATDGQEVAGESISDHPDGDAKTIRIAFRVSSDANSKYLRGSDLGALTSPGQACAQSVSGPSGIPASFGAVSTALGGPTGSGYTDGPDLSEVVVDKNDPDYQNHPNVVTFGFYEGPIQAPDASKFRLLKSDGTLTEPGTVTKVDEDSVTVQFTPDQMSNAVAGYVGDCAVRDYQPSNTQPLRGCTDSGPGKPNPANAKQFYTPFYYGGGDTFLPRPPSSPSGSDHKAQCAAAATHDRQAEHAQRAKYIAAEKRYASRLRREERRIHTGRARARLHRRHRAAVKRLRARDSRTYRRAVARHRAAETACLKS